MTLGSTDRPLSEVYDLTMLDLDGVVYVGPDAVPGAVEALNALDIPVSYLTNNATRTAADIADHLRSFGITLADHAVVTAGQVVAAQVVKDLGVDVRVLLAGAAGMRRALEDVGVTVVTSASDHPGAVVQGGVDDVRWSELAEASYAIAAGVPWYASNPDLTFPTAHGLAPGNGALVQAVRFATGAEPIVAGKPGRLIYDTARERFPGARPLMVGDRLDTDIDGAIGVGIDTLQVLTGVNDLQDVINTSPGHRPTYVSLDLAGLNESHDPVQIDGLTARCGDAVATVIDGVLTVEGADRRDTRSIRAAVGLAWDIADRTGERVHLDGTMKP